MTSNPAGGPQGPQSSWEAYKQSWTEGSGIKNFLRGALAACTVGISEGFARAYFYFTFKASTDHIGNTDTISSIAKNANVQPQTYTFSYTPVDISKNQYYEAKGTNLASVPPITSLKEGDTLVFKHMEIQPFQTIEHISTYKITKMNHTGSNQASSFFVEKDLRNNSKQEFEICISGKIFRGIATRLPS